MKTALRIGVAVGIVALLTQCSSVQKGEATPVSPSAAPHIARADVAAWLGDWTGAIHQSTAPPYTVNMTLTHDGDTVVGSVAYPELDCIGTLGDAHLAGEVLTIVETITDGEDACITPVGLHLTLRPNEIGYRFDDEGGGDGVLHRPSVV